MNCPEKDCSLETPHEHCMVCSKVTDRTELEYVELGKHFPPDTKVTRMNPQTGENETFQLYRNFYSCANCAIKEKLAWYKLQYEMSRENVEKLREENNAFRTLMLNVETMHGVGEHGDDVSIKTYIRSKRPGWEALPVDTLHLFMQLYLAHATAFSDLYSKKASQAEIKAHLEKKSQTAKVNHANAVEKARIQSNDGLKGEYTADEKKAVKSLMKAMKCTEEVAYKHICDMMKMAQAKK